MKKAIIDVDNTLWNFSEPLHKILQRMNSGIPHPDEWHDWGRWKEFIQTPRFFQAVNAVHKRQSAYKPFDGASAFLKILKEDLGFHITIASHRSKKHAGELSAFLHGNGLIHDEVHALRDKSALYLQDASYVLIIDDKPSTLTDASASGLISAGLRCPWNTGLGLDVFDDYEGLLAHIRACGPENIIRECAAPAESVQPTLF